MGTTLWRASVMLALLCATPAMAEEAATGCRFDTGLSSYHIEQCSVSEDGGTLTMKWPRYVVRLVVAASGKQAEASWSGLAGGDQPTHRLGTMNQQGDCWANEKTTICFRRERGRADNANANSEAGTYDADIAEEMAGDREESQRADANEAAIASLDHASSFRGLQLGMNAKQISDILPSELTLFNQRRRPTSDKGIEEMNFVKTVLEAQAPNGAPFGSLFILDSDGRLCGEISFVSGRSDKSRLLSCYFGVAKDLTLEDFARQVTDTYQLEQGMAYDMRFFGSGMNRVQYYEYAGDRQATSERFTVARNTVSNVLTLTVERILSVNFN